MLHVSVFFESKEFPGKYLLQYGRDFEAYTKEIAIDMVKIWHKDAKCNSIKLTFTSQDGTVLEDEILTF